MQYGYTTLAGVGINVVAVGMEYVTVNSGGGTDVVTLYDSAGNDSLGVHSGYASMTGSGYALVATVSKMRRPTPIPAATRPTCTTRRATTRTARTSTA